MENVLMLFKVQLGIAHKERDQLYLALLQAYQKELEGRGVQLTLSDIEDQILLCDYALWVYKKREEAAVLSPNLHLRIMNKKIRSRGNDE